MPIACPLGCQLSLCENILQQRENIILSRVNKMRGNNALQHHLRWVFVLAAVLIGPGAAWAEPSFNAELLVPTTDNGPYLNTYSTRMLGKYKWTVGTTIDVAHRPIELVGPSGGRVSGILEDLLMMHLLGAFGITDWVQIGIDVPIALLDRTIDTVTGNAEVQIRFSDIRLEGKFRLLDPDDPRYKGWGIAAIPFINFPSGSGARLVGNKSFAGGAKIAFESPNLGNIARIALNVGYQIRNGTTLFGTQVDDWFLYSLGINFRVTDYFEIIPEVWGQTVAKNFFGNKPQSPLEMGGLFRVLVANRKVSLDFGGSAGVIEGVGAPVWRGTFRVAYNPLRRAKDAVLGDIPVPTTLTPEEYYLLSKKCPPEDEWNAATDDEACEKVYELRGLYGECPNPDEFDASLHDEACEKVYELQAFDADGDGVPDYMDRCPDDPGPVENDGCPAMGIVELDWSGGRVKSDKILFQFGSAELTSESLQVVSAIADKLAPKMQYITRVFVEGHTDSVGRREYNQVLSVRRAQAVREVFLARGIPSRKMTVRGFGQARPAVSNETEAGQAQNRRVDIRFDGKLPYDGYGSSPDSEPTYDSAPPPPAPEPEYVPPPPPPSPPPSSSDLDSQARVEDF